MADLPVGARALLNGKTRVEHVLRFVWTGWGLAVPYTASIAFWLAFFVALPGVEAYNFAGKRPWIGIAAAACFVCAAAIWKTADLEAKKPAGGGSAPNHSSTISPATASAFLTLRIRGWAIFFGVLGPLCLAQYLG